MAPTAARLRGALVLCLLLLAGPADCVWSFDFGDIQEVLKFSRELVTDVLESYHLIKPKLANDRSPDFPFVRLMEKRLLNDIGRVSAKIEQYEGRLEHRTEVILDALLERVPEREMLEQGMHELWKYVGQVESTYQIFVYYARAPNQFEQFTLEDFAKNAVTSGLNALPDVLKMIHRLVVPPNSNSDVFRRSVLTLLARNMQEASMQICNTQQSAQQLLFNLYNTIALTEIKGYTMMQFSFTLLKLYDKGNFTREMEQLKQEYAIRTSETLRAVKAAMEVAPREIWTCDPSKHKPGVTYTELSEVFQGYIVNEVDMNNQGTCMENCDYYTYSKVYGCYKNQFCAQQRRCNGKLVNCQYVDSDMWICPSDKNSSRRYEYIEYENGLVYGKKDKCHRGTTKVDSWWRWLFWHCSYCMCFCDEQNLSSERHFNLRNVTSNIDDNKVVTALRIRKQNQIIHIQIQEGKLLPRGGIDGKSIAWKKVDNYTIFDADVKADTDYHTITWQNRAVDLDDLHAESEHLLTGIKFRLIGKHLNLEIRVTPFNFTTGMLIKEKSFWHSEDTTEIGEMYGTNGEILKSNKRTEFKLKNPDIPTRSIAQSVPDSQTNQYLMFSPSDLRKDAAQSTVPFIDLQAVEPKPPVPISGAGIYHKGRDGYGGFLALKLYTYNFETQLRAELPYSTPVVGLSNDIQS